MLPLPLPSPLRPLGSASMPSPPHPKSELTLPLFTKKCVGSTTQKHVKLSQKWAFFLVANRENLGGSVQTMTDNPI